MTFAGAKWLALSGGLFLVAVGESLLTPVMVAAVRRYANTAQRSISFSIFYAMMNAGFFVAGWIFDYVRLGLGEYGHYTVPLLGVELSTYRTLFLISLLLTLPNLLIIYFCLRGGVEATDRGLKITPEQPKYAGQPLLPALGCLARDTARDTVRIFAGLWRQPAFFKFLVFLSLVVAVRLIFYHMYYTYPKFGIRELASTNAVFSLGEIRHAPSLALKLKAKGDPVSADLFTRFSEAGQRALAAYPESGARHQTLQEMLRAELNRIVLGGPIHDAERFQAVKLRELTREKLKQPPQDGDPALLNRLLLEDAYPKFLGAGAPIGRLWSINALLIVILVPLVGALTQRISAYRMVTIGSAISAASVFIMALPPVWFRPLADGLPGHWIAHVWLGVEGVVNPYYVMIFLYVVLLSVGESLWSPRVYEYTATIAPKGQEASYMSLSYLPFFVAKFFVGMFSGLLLARYCPETGPRDSGTLWLIIALTTLITPVGLLLLRRYIRVEEAGRAD
jgi:MFS family permease